MPSFTREFRSDKGIKLEVDGYFRYEGMNSIEITESIAWRWEDRDNLAAPNYTLTDSEWDRLHEELMADPHTWEYDDDVY